VLLRDLCHCPSRILRIEKTMSRQKVLAVLPELFLLLGVSTIALAQGATQARSVTPTASADTQEKNIQEYIELLRADVRQQKDEIMGAVMELDAEQSAKFWPIYSEYDAELTKLNKQIVANILEYADNYDQMTDAKADELVQKDIDLHNQRSALLGKYYGRVKAALGSIQAARFAQIEDQLLLLIDLQIASSLPTAGQGS